MLLQSFLSAGLFAALVSVAAADGSCSATTIFYNSPAQLQVSLASVASSYSICNVTATTTSTSVTPTSTCARVANPPCFYIVGHGEPHMEGKQLGWQAGQGSPRFDYAPSIFYIDSLSHLTVANTINPPEVTMTYYYGTESWWGISPADTPAKDPTDYQFSTCTAYANGTLDCYQYGGINSDILNVYISGYGDFRDYYLPHWGNAAKMVPITLTWQQTACPALC